MKILSLSTNEVGIVVNALMSLRNKLLASNKDYECINELLIKIIDTPEKKRDIFKFRGR